MASPTPSNIGKPNANPDAAEPGQTTTEFKVSIGAFIVVLAAWISVAADFGFKLPPGAQDHILGALSATLGIIPVGYALARGIRKVGTPG